MSVYICDLYWTLLTFDFDVKCVDVMVKLMRSMETEQLKFNSMAQSTVIDVKEMLQKKWNISPEDQTLMHNGIKLPDEYSLSDCGVMEGSELELVVSAHCESSSLPTCFAVYL